LPSTRSLRRPKERNWPHTWIVVPQGSARCSPEGIELSTGWEFDALTLFLDGDAELIELIQVNR
jgi:hypothetical protein